MSCTVTEGTLGGPNFSRAKSSDFLHVISLRTEQFTCLSIILFYRHQMTSSVTTE